jgi:hypothetical protein
LLGCGVAMPENTIYSSLYMRDALPLAIGVAISAEIGRGLSADAMKNLAPLPLPRLMAKSLNC